MQLAKSRYSARMKVVASNRRARFDYEITETVEAGLVLTGQEVKSCRAGHVDLKGSYLSFVGAKPTLKHMTIKKYAFASGLDSYDPGQERHLLLGEKEAAMLREASEQSGMSVIPLEVRAGKFIKVLLGVAKGKKLFDKRQKIKEREVKRRMHEGRE